MITQDNMRQLLNELKSKNLISAEFKPEIEQLGQEVDTRIYQQEGDMFRVANWHINKEQLTQLGRGFKENKKQLETQMSS